MMNAARNQELLANTRENSKYAVTRSHRVMNSDGDVLEIQTVTRFAADAGQVAEILAHLEWLNENRTELGKYFDIKVTEI